MIFFKNIYFLFVDGFLLFLKIDESNFYLFSKNNSLFTLFLKINSRKTFKYCCKCKKISFSNLYVYATLTNKL